ncbi:site-specific DNA-methyltransferase [Nesterenkonia massiliensis]|uniref:site-specific DNA-methyltransferase n=1 Tax=Nesterenkonia massiliensis TaxID=1232429 RepID=UPI00041E996A|nr:site-specific DNA-methyltransferase [Nesterenkonia massiliensis]
MHDELNKIPGTTPDFRTELAEKLADLVPEAVADGKIDTKKLEELLNGDAADTRERFGLFWPGKKRALRAAQEPTTATLVPDKENSKDWDTTQNVFIEGDNLEVLKILQRHYHGKIKMIYIDPPYNTGKDFVYPDNYQEGLKSYLEFTKQVDEGGKKISTNSDQAGRYHSNWLNMMYPRLKLARNLLTDDGVIFISIDDHEVDNLKKLGNEVFGEGNFAGQIIWKNSSKNDQDYVSVQHEYFLVWVRSKNFNKGQWVEHKEGLDAIYKKFDELHRKYGTDWDTIHAEALKWFGGFNESNPIYASKHYSWMDEKGVYSPQNIAGPNYGQYRYDVIHPVTNKPVKEPASGWRYPEPTMLKRIEQGLVKFGKDETTVPNNKVYLRDNETQSLTSIKFKDGRVSSNALKTLLGGSYFTNPKNVDLLAQFIQAVGVSGDDIVLDFFSGSATTAHAVMQLNAQDGQSRRHIQVQLPEPLDEKDEAHKAGFRTIADISRKRISLAAGKIREDYRENLENRGVSIDLGFRSFRLADTNFAKWRLTSDVAETELEQHLLSLRESADDQASQEALLTELLLKRGYSLTEQVDVFDVAGLEIHGVKDDEGDYGLLAYLNEHQKPSLEGLRALVDAAEAQIVILEDAFQGDDQLKTNLAQLCKSKGIELWTA